jgi:hypothetical protein
MSGAERGPVTWALEKALEHAGTGDRDAATVALARRYARDLDDASVVSTQAAKLLRELEGVLDDVQYDRVAALAARVEETAVLALLGPKLQVTLSELGMTPRARTEIAGKGGGNGPPVDNPVARRRATRATRLHSA